MKMQYPYRTLVRCEKLFNAEYKDEVQKEVAMRFLKLANKRFRELKMHDAAVDVFHWWRRLGFRKLKKTVRV